MDDKLEEIVGKKIDATFDKINEVKKIIKSLDELSIQDNNAFAYGIIIGRLYNSFFYQCRRILKRDPTEDEFSEFLQILKSRQSEFLKKF